MSYETVIDQIKSLPESSLEEVSRYIEFLLYQQEQTDMAPLIESDEVFEEKNGTRLCRCYRRPWKTDGRCFLRFVN